ncbi:hypothetical protein CCACVL1_16923 [Corchorus capsularis]|uniref:DM2 domain-containing protein n=1 Tax=Corchorus capsularis TaxID=210143 RepID=A0A1R3HUW5_COCAP|nr:hypothetical protein CCACVL1_16923 [Corchorus capsularis]
MVSDSDLVTRLREILRDSDLETATAGSVRRQLEEDFGVDLSDKKAFVRDQIDLFLETLNQENEKEHEEVVEEGEEEEEEETRQLFIALFLSRESSKADKQVKKRGGGFQKVCSLSPQLQKVVGESELPRTEVVKKIWSYIRENNLQDPKNRRNIICDESLHAIFRVKSINMFQMNKALTKHIWPLSEGNENVKDEMICEDNNDSASVDSEKSEEEDKEEDKDKGREEEDEEKDVEEEGEEEEKDEQEEEEEEEEEDEEEQEQEGEEEEEEEDVPEKRDGNTRRSKNKRSSKVDNHKAVKKRGGGFTKLCSLSPQLQAFIGESELARTEVVKRLWNYIREKNLQNPKDKRNILCDESLRAIFRVNTINMFQMNKALSKHIWPLNEEDAQADLAKSERKPKQGRERGAYEPKQKEKRQKKGPSGFLAPLPLSDALMKFFGTGENALSRADVVKRMWEYIKQNDLQDPSDKRRIICDDKLKELFEVDSFTGFTISKLLTTHFIKMEEAPLGSFTWTTRKWKDKDRDRKKATPDLQVANMFGLRLLLP